MSQRNTAHTDVGVAPVGEVHTEQPHFARVLPRPVSRLPATSEKISDLPESPEFGFVRVAVAVGEEVEEELTRAACEQRSARLEIQPWLKSRPAVERVSHNVVDDADYARTELLYLIDKVSNVTSTRAHFGAVRLDHTWQEICHAEGRLTKVVFGSPEHQLISGGLLQIREDQPAPVK